jgi:hypothetical protein
LFTPYFAYTWTSFPNKKTLEKFEATPLQKLPAAESACGMFFRKLTGIFRSTGVAATTHSARHLLLLNRNANFGPRKKVSFFFSPIKQNKLLARN